MSKALDPHAAIVTEAAGLDQGGPLLTTDGEPLGRALKRSSRRARRRAFLLVLPLLLFIVITFGLSANNMPAAIVAAVAGVLLVLVVGVAVRAPLSRVPENTLKYGVGLLLAAFGTFWAAEGLGALRAGRESLEWPGSDLAILALIAAWFLLSRVLVSVLRRPATATIESSAPSHATL